MKDNKIILMGALAVALLSTHVKADNNALVVRGTVAAAGCSLIVSDYKDAKWAIGDVSLTGRPAAGDVLKGPTGFVNLSLTGCPAGITVAYKFDGQPDADMPTLFKVAKGVGQATGVAFKLELGSGEQLLPQTNSQFYVTTEQGTTGNYVLSGKAVRGSLIATGGETNFTGTPGKLDTTMTYSLIYN